MSGSASYPELTQAISWLALGFCVPEDWEIVRHGIGFERGSLVFVDRVRQRLSVSWTACPRAPDLERLLSDFGNQPLTVGEKVLDQQDHSGFRVLECETQIGDHVTHALCFDPLSKRLIELELPAAGAPHDALAPALLASFTFAQPEHGQRVRAFGVHAEVPEGFRLSASQVKPADVNLEFERSARRGERSAERLRIRRSGMARTWFGGDAARSIRLRRPELRFHDFRPAAVGPHTAVVARGYPRGAILQRAFGLVAPRSVTLWECPEQNAVFETEVCVPRGQDANSAELSVWCCAGHAKEARHGG